LTIFLRFLGCSSFFLRIFDVEAIFFLLSMVINAKMHARMLWRRLRIMLSISLNFSFCQNEKPFSFDQNENNATFTENLKLFQWFKMFHSFIDLGLSRAALCVNLFKAPSPETIGVSFLVAILSTILLYLSNAVSIFLFLDACFNVSLRVSFLAKCPL
jgi:hypothetical protein